LLVIAFPSICHSTELWREAFSVFVRPLFQQKNAAKTLIIGGVFLFLMTMMDLPPMTLQRME
jgi:hypothetical protein